jgi:elongation factor Ts
MGEVTPALVKALREKTGAGMMDCKKALTETGGDLEAAVDWLRKKGLAAAAKKAGRMTAEGLVGVAVKGTVGAVVEMNSETDFVARNVTFQAFVKTVADLAADSQGDRERILAASYPGTDRTVADETTHLIATLGENISLRRAAALSADSGALAQYVHNALAPGLGKIGVLVALDSQGDKEKLGALGKQLAMHVAAASPLAVSREDLDPALLDREREVFAAQARASGKPENIVEKMVEGRLRKFYEDAVLLDQTFVIDAESKIAEVLKRAAGDVGAPVAVTGFVRFALGEGIEREEKDFAAEVSAQLGA